MTYKAGVICDWDDCDNETYQMKNLFGWIEVRIYDSESIDCFTDFHFCSRDCLFNYTREYIMKGRD